MANVTLYVIEGIEAGQVFRDCPTPVTIGREDENQIQLNDERISRFHAKIQEEGGRLILTDCQSTNGTRVNGHPVQMRTVLPGDQLMIGRCTLVVGLPEGSQLVSKIRRSEDDEGMETDSSLEIPDQPEGVDQERNQEAFPLGPPPVPHNLTTVQAAEISDILEYLRTELLTTIKSMSADETDAQIVKLSRPAWQRIQEIPAQISQYLDRISDPSLD